jgi:hypothetical protein
VASGDTWSILLKAKGKFAPQMRRPGPGRIQNSGGLDAIATTVFKFFSYLNNACLKIGLSELISYHPGFVFTFLLWYTNRGDLNLRNFQQIRAVIQ